MGMFAYRFKSLRLKHDLSQQKLADELNISKSSVSMYERGQREPDFETLKSIANFFNVDMNYLIGYSDNHKDRNLDIRRIGYVRKNMDQKTRDKMMRILEASFEDYFGDDFVDEDDD